MKLINILVVISLFFVTMTGCDKDDNKSINCDKQAIISADEYNTAPTDQLTINKIEINGDCLKINFRSSGCSGDTWKLKLIDSGVLHYSNPPQRKLRLSLKNEEMCRALITKELTFDIRELQVEGNQVLLSITNSDNQILYEYL